MRTALETLGYGLLAGAAGAASQSLFFRSTKRLAPPSTPPASIHLREPLQVSETSTETVARRFSEGLMARPSLGAMAKARGAIMVHYGFGALWGGAYGLVRESWPRVASVPGAAGFSVVVWGVSDNLLLPIFGVAAWPHHYPARTHLYALAAHLAYGAAVAGVYELLRSRRLASLALVWLFERRAVSRMPRLVRPVVRPVVRTMARVGARRPASRVRAAIEDLAAP